MDGTNFFGPWEGDAITSWIGAMSAIEDVLNKIGRRRMVWRGQVNAKWCLHSGLYRRVLATGSGPSPNESDLVKAEHRLLTIARERWRYDQLPYLELVAHMQHYRAPTRLLDVSLNPLVALWFAVEQQHSDEDHQDGRLFAIDVTNRTIRLDSEWSTYDIPWRGYPKDSKWSLELPSSGSLRHTTTGSPLSSLVSCLPVSQSFIEDPTPSTVRDRATVVPPASGRLTRCGVQHRYPHAWLTDRGTCDLTHVQP